MKRDEKIRAIQKNLKGELVEGESPKGLWDLYAEGENLRDNPYKTPPSNLTNKNRIENEKG